MRVGSRNILEVQRAQTVERVSCLVEDFIQFSIGTSIFCLQSETVVSAEYSSLSHSITCKRKSWPSMDTEAIYAHHSFARIWIKSTKLQQGILKINVRICGAFPNPFRVLNPSPDLVMSWKLRGF